MGWNTPSSHMSIARPLAPLYPNVAPSAMIHSCAMVPAGMRPYLRARYTCTYQLFISYSATMRETTSAYIARARQSNSDTSFSSPFFLRLKQASYHYILRFEAPPSARTELRVGEGFERSSRLEEGEPFLFCLICLVSCLALPFEGWRIAAYLAVHHMSSRYRQT